MDMAFKDVDIKAGDDFSAFAGQACRSTYWCSPYVTVHDFGQGHFRGPRGYRLNTDRYPWLDDVVITAAPDGIGTKVAITNLAGFHRVQARDLFAMTGGDITRWGGLRLVFTNILDVNAISQGGQTLLAMQELMLGLAEVAQEQRVVVLNGETAELGQFVGSVDPNLPLRYNWCGVMIGAYHQDRMILGNAMRPGQIILALPERGFRSNGFTTVRGVLASPFGERWWENADPSAKEAIAASAEPSMVYDRLLEDANGWNGRPRIPVSAIAHLSGGGIPTKLGDLLRQRGLSAVLDNLYEPPAIMQKCLEWGKLTPRYAYERWSSGQGALVVLDEEFVEDFQALAYLHDLETRKCGQVVPSYGPPKIKIFSKYKSGEELQFTLPQLASTDCVV